MTSATKRGVVPSVGAFAARRPWLVVAAWVVLLAAALTAAQTWGLRFADAIEIPGADSQHAADVIAAQFPSRGSQATLVVVGRSGVRQADDSFSVTLAEATRKVPHVTEVGPFAPSADGRALLAQVSFDRPAADLKETAGALAQLAQPDAAHDVAFGGEVIAMHQAPEPGHAELIGLAVALLVMVLAFRSVMAALLPLLTGIAASVVGIIAVGLLGQRVEVSSAAPMLASMLGLGVGIDYALFFVTRVREERGLGRDLEAAIVEAADHSGRAILFAGASVVLALTGLALTRVSLLMALGLAAAMVVVMSVLAALTLLPALVKLGGRFIGETKADSGEGNLFASLARGVSRRPARFALIATAVLLAIAAPALQLRLGFPDDSAQPEGCMARRAYELVAAHYGPGTNGPLILVVEDAAHSGLAERVSEAVGHDAEVAAAMPPMPASDGVTSLVVVLPKHAPQDTEVAALVTRLRQSVMPSLALTGTQRVSVGGMVAMTMDLSILIAQKLPVVIAAVLATIFLLLLVVFRSVLVPLKAVLMNLLSVGAAYGVLVIVFQWGFGRQLVGLDHAMPIVSILPLLLFALLFGLSMDYEVFLLARIREEHERGHGTTQSVALALARTGRVVSSAATIMVAVFVTFALGPDPIIKMFGVGLASAILLDATLVRVVLVPATMVMLGEANWWFPRFFARWVPSVRVE